MSRALTISVEKLIAEKENEFGIYQGSAILYEAYEKQMSDWRQLRDEAIEAWRKAKIAELIANLNEPGIVQNINLDTVSYSDRLDRNPNTIRLSITLSRGNVDLSDLDASLAVIDAQKPEKPAVYLKDYYDKMGRNLPVNIVKQRLSEQITALKSLAEPNITQANYERICQMN
jgi:hypothetical protein